MKTKSNISVCLATLNEEPDLPDCLKSVRDFADEIIVVDGESSDKTVAIAKRFGAKITITKNHPIFHINKQKAIDQAKSNWVLQLDADERVTPELREELLGISTRRAGGLEDRPVAYWIKRRKMFLGRWIKKGGHYPDPVIRFFRKGKARLPCRSVHEQMEVDGKLGWLSGELIHLPTPSFSVYLTKDNRYSTLGGQELLEKDPGLGSRQMLRYLLWAPFSTWFSMFVRHKGYEDGFPGFVFAFYSGFTTINAYIKYWEAKKVGTKYIAKDWV